VQRIRNKKGSKLNGGEEEPGLKEKVKRQGECSGSGTRKDPKLNKGEEDPGLKEKGKRQGEYSGSGTNRIQYC